MDSFCNCSIVLCCMAYAIPDLLCISTYFACMSRSLSCDTPSIPNRLRTSSASLPNAATFMNWVAPSPAIPPNDARLVPNPAVVFCRISILSPENLAAAENLEMSSNDDPIVPAVLESSFLKFTVRSNKLVASAATLVKACIANPIAAPTSPKFSATFDAAAPAVVSEDPNLPTPSCPDSNAAPKLPRLLVAKLVA